MTYVVFTEMATPAQVEEAKSLFWDHVEAFTLALRNDVSTWSDENWFGDLTIGIVAGYFIYLFCFLYLLFLLFL
jgi:hypothetical protein